MAKTTLMSDETRDTRILARCARGYDWNTVNDSESLIFGSGSDISVAWDGTRLNVTQGTTNSEVRWGVDGAGIDQRWYGDTASAYLLWDQSADSLLLGPGAKIGPSANDGAALGSATVSFSDLFLATGGVINWANGDATITHSANTLAFAGASTGYTFDALTSVTVASLNATTGRSFKVDGTVLTPNFGDGYGAVEVNLNIGTGAIAGYTAGLSSWINLAADTTFAGGSLITPLDVGIYGATGITMTNSRMIMGLKMSCVIDDGANPASLFLFQTNIYSNALTAMFDVNTIVDIAAASGAASSGAYKFPFLKERSTGTVWYANLYTS